MNPTQDPCCRRWALLAPLLAALVCASGARAQSVPSPTPQFDVLGFVQAATLDGTICPSISDPQLWGGTVTVNGIQIVVPCNSIVQMPASTLTWAMLFPVLDANGNIAGSAATPVGPGEVAINGQAAPQAPGQTGLALSDSTTSAGTPATTGPFPSFEIHVVGNVVNGRYIAGLIVPISQQGLNAAAGRITCIDYANGLLYVGGDPSQPCVLANGAPNGSRIQINDPIGRWGIAHSPDPRFSADTNNTTVHATTGFPMCIPRVAPNGSADGGDPQCPAGNRPLNGDTRFPVDPYLASGAPLKTFTMLRPPQPAFGTPACQTCVPATDAVPPAPPVYPDARYQAPFMVGDWINYSGTLARDASGQTYISAHTIDANLGIFTTPFTQPSYLVVDSILLGTGGTSVDNISVEPTTRIFVVGFTTDPANLVDINAVDVNPCSGAETVRLLATVDPGSQAVKGRFRLHVLGGTFMPPTREMLVVSEGGTTPASAPYDPNQPGLPLGAANGLGSGQYRLPNFDFIFPENVVVGQPILSNNFQDLPFLAQGSGPLFGYGSVVGQLTPWPGSPVPTPVTCATVGGVVGTAPVVSAGVDFAVGPNRSETLAGTLAQDPNGGSPTISWTQTGGPPVPYFSPATGSLTPSFTTPPVGINDPPVVLTFQLTVTDAFGTSSSSVNVTVYPTTDTLSAVTAVWRAPVGGLHKVGVKGGVLSVSANAPPSDPTVTLFVVGYGSMEISPVVGLPTYVLKVTGVAAPYQVTIRSSRGGEATVPVTLQ